MKVVIPLRLLATTFVLAGVLPRGACAQSASTRTLVLAVDGLSHEAFLAARARGLFAGFNRHGRHIAPYPSMSNPSWAEVFGTRRLYGDAQGNVRTAEATFFDLDHMRIVDDPRNVFNRQANPYHYLHAFDYVVDPLVEPLMYLPNARLLTRELEELERSVTTGFTGPHYVAFVSGVDAVAHTHPEALHPYLARLDAAIERIRVHFAARGDALAIWLVSDHGNAGGFREGERERPLELTTLLPAARAAGLTMVSRGELTRAHQIASPVLALGSVAGVYFADLSRRRSFALAALRDPAVQLITWLEVAPDGGRHVVVLGAGGTEAQLYWRGRDDTRRYAYRAIRGDPLGLAPRVRSAGTSLRFVSDGAMRDATLGTDYPDAAFRLVESASKQVENAPDLVVNLRDGWAFSGMLTRYVTMLRTHGALSSRASSGVVASTGGRARIPAVVRSRDVLGLIGVSEAEVFHRARDLRRDPAAALQALRASVAGGVPTHIDDEAPVTRFLRRSRPLIASMDVFDAELARELADAASAAGRRSDSSAHPARAVRGPDAPPSDGGTGRRTRAQRWRDGRAVFDRADVVEGVTQHLDSILALEDVDFVEQPPESVLTDVERRLARVPGLAPLAELRRALSPAPGSPRADNPGGGHDADRLRRALMKLYTIPFFLNEALASPEMEHVPETRDLAFATHWTEQGRERVRRDPALALRDTLLGRTLFREAYAERRLWGSVAPATVPLVYNPLPDDVTVVYVPGIYNELFDREIWSRGLRAVRERLGVRTLYADVDGRCASAYNAERLVALLRADTRRRLERGYARPRYVVLGYSKGGVDATEALLLDTAFTRAQIAGLVTVATPHHGTRLVAAADLPALLTERAVTRPLPPVCRQDDERAAHSLLPVTRARFWEEQEAALIGLTRYASLSFVSDVSSAHPWMKLSKQLADFRESNDGVVPLGGSRFPASLGALDLGIVDADHLAGILASDFPQAAFLEAVFVALFELRAFEPVEARALPLVVARAVASAAPASADAAIVRPAAGVAAVARVARRPAVLAPRRITWDAGRLTSTRRPGKLMSAEVTPMTPDRYPLGVRLVCDHLRMRDFRAEHELYYDVESGVVDDRLVNGFTPVVVDTERGSDIACRLRTRAASVKMTTVSYRFRPADYPELALRLKVVRGVTGADPTKMGRGRNDTAFKIWFVLRNLREGQDGDVRLFGYYWADANVRGEVVPLGALTEASSSRKRILVVTLPEAWHVAIGGPADTNRWIEPVRDLAADIQRAYPQERIEDLQVVAITIQTDSDDTRSESEVYLKSLTILPRGGGVAETR